MEEKTVYIQDDEITLKELILKIREFWLELWRYKWWIAIMGLLGAGVSVLLLLRKPTLYTAPLTYMVNEDEGNGFGGMASVLGQFGLAGGGNSEFNLDKITELSRANKIVFPVLLDSIMVDGKSDYTANHIIQLYKYHEKWKDSKDENLHGFLFTPDNLESPTGRKALKSVTAKVVGNEKKDNDPLLSSGYGEETGILQLKVVSESEELSYHLVNGIYTELSTYYIEKAIEPQQETVNVLQEKADSIRIALAQAEYQLANFDATNRGLWDERNRVKRDPYQRKVTFLTIMQGEVLKNLETANFALQSKTPFFQLIDEPVMPLLPAPKSLPKSILIGGFLGGFLACGYFILRKIYRDTMAT